MYDLTSLELGGDEFMALPEGDYHFRVTGHSVEMSKSEKLPANTQVIIANLEIPTLDGIVSIKHRMNVYGRVMFLITQFATCIGILPEGAQQKLDIKQMDGCDGIAHFGTREYNGNTYNEITRGGLYPPSKAPKVTMNDGAWETYLKTGGVEAEDNGELPF